MVDITKSEGEEVNPSSKQTQDKETGATAQSEDDLSPVVKLKRVYATSGGVDAPQQGHQYITDEEKRTAAAALELLQETEDVLQKMAPKLNLVKQLTSKVQA